MICGCVCVCDVCVCVNICAEEESTGLSRVLVVDSELWPGAVDSSKSFFSDSAVDSTGLRQFCSLSLEWWSL